MENTHWHMAELMKKCIMKECVLYDFMLLCSTVIYIHNFPLQDFLFQL